MPGSKRKQAFAAPEQPLVDGNTISDTPPAKTRRNASQQDVAAAKNAKAVAKAAPVLQWMRVPVALEGTAALALKHVHGLDPRMAAALQQGSVAQRGAMLQTVEILWTSYAYHHHL